MSRVLNSVLRHYGCVDESSLACDSGGWYLIEDIVQTIRPRKWGDLRPRWVLSMEEKLADNNPQERQRILDFTQDDWRRIIFVSIVPGWKDRPRFQILLEQIRDSAENNALRPLAMRATSGHSLIDILDPERIAANVPDRIGMYIAGIFHVTTWDKLGSIFRKGLHPGGFSTRKPRMDSHFTPFFPTDPRNGYMKKRLDH